MLYELNKSISKGVKEEFGTIVEGLYWCVTRPEEDKMEGEGTLGYIKPLLKGIINICLCRGKSCKGRYIDIVIN